MTINWWRAVWDFTSHNKHNKTIKEKAMGSGDEGKWWWMDAAKWIVMAAWMLHGACVGEEAGGRNLVFFPGKWLRPAMKGTSCVRRLRFRSFRGQSVPLLCSATSGCSCVRNSLRFLNLWLQIALEWLHDCCHLVLQVCYVMLRNAL